MSFLTMDYLLFILWYNYLSFTVLIIEAYLKECKLILDISKIINLICCKLNDYY